MIKYTKIDDAKLPLKAQCAELYTFAKISEMALQTDEKVGKVKKKCSA